MASKTKNTGVCQHNATPGRFLKTSSMPLTDGFLLLAVGAIPLFILEMVKVVRHARRQDEALITHENMKTHTQTPTTGVQRHVHTTTRLPRVAGEAT